MTPCLRKIRYHFFQYRAIMTFILEDGNNIIFYLALRFTVLVLRLRMPVIYICLDNAGGTLGALQLEWLKKVLLYERSQYRYCILVNHNNWIRLRRMAATNPYVEELEVLLDLCLRHKVDLVISGHDHERHTAVFGNTRFITLDALSDSYPTPSYAIISVSPDSISYSYKNL